MDMQGPHETMRRHLFEIIPDSEHLYYINYMLYIEHLLDFPREFGAFQMIRASLLGYSGAFLRMTASLADSIAQSLN